MTTGFDFSTYRPPGLYTEAVPGPQLAAQSATPTAVGIFGVAVGYQRAVESLVVDPDIQDSETQEFASAINRTLKNPGIIPESVIVRNPNSGEAYTRDADYTLYKVSGGTSAESTRDDLYTIRRVIDGEIDQGDTIEVSYRYTDPSYFDARMFYDFDDVRDAYGTPFDSLGNIQSELTLAASFAFQNNAQRVILVAVDAADPGTPTLAEYQAALDKLSDQSDVSIVVPATGIQQVQQSVVAHVNRQSTGNFERRAIIGRDGSATPVASNALISDANAIKSSRIALVSPAAIKYYAPELNREIILGGQYLAAALAGVAVSQNAAQPLTRKQVVGFAGLQTKPQVSQLNLESQNGLTVIEQTRAGTLRVRHGVTTDPTNILTREWNIIGQQDAMVYRIRAYLDNDQLIGGVIDDITLPNVKASAAGALDSLQMDGVIRGYRDLKIRQLETLPDVLEIRFAWQPSMALNYIVVRYSISLATGEEANVTPVTA